jgi:hypothetical protein
VNGHNILEEVLHIEPMKLWGLSPYQRAALALEILDGIEVPGRGDLRRLLLVAKEAVTHLREHFG